MTFIEVLKDREGGSLELEPGVTSGDYLNGFLLGTRAALYENHRESLTVTLPAAVAVASEYVRSSLSISDAVSCPSSTVFSLLSPAGT